MNNISQHRAQEQSLEYSHQSSNKSNSLDYGRLSDSLQYLDRVRSINKKIFDATSNKCPAIISPLQKLVQSNKQITYIDNQKVYGIIKIQNYTKLKSRVEELQNEYEKYKQLEHQFRKRNAHLDKELSDVKTKQAQVSQVLDQLQKAIIKEQQSRKDTEKKAKQLQDALFKLCNQNVQFSQQYLALNTDLQMLKTKKQNQNALSQTQKIVCETQTQVWKPRLNITPFQPNLEEILKKLRQKEGEKICRPTLKEIVTQSLDAFLKELDTQFHLIYQQSIDLTTLREKNLELIQQNSSLKEKLGQIKIEEEKLKIFKNCMTQFLQDTSQNVSKQIQGERKKQKFYQQLTEDQRILVAQSLHSVQSQYQTDRQNPFAVQLRKTKQTIEFLKKQNLNLLKTIGQYQFKWKNVEKVLDENKKEEIPDDGTIGQLVKMSKLVKESIKNLLHQL